MSSGLRPLNETPLGESVEEWSLLALARSELERGGGECWTSTLGFYFVGSGSTGDSAVSQKGTLLIWSWAVGVGSNVMATLHSDHSLYKHDPQTSSVLLPASFWSHCSDSLWAQPTFHWHAI